jgi:uncharacterized protein (TIGR00730 family)
MAHVRVVCVYCGSSPGRAAEYREAAAGLGSEIARRGLALVYGGARVGLMGVLADAALAGGGRVIGVIPQGLARKEIAHEGLTRLIQVKTMHERKQAMADLADGFVAMPGGLGTLEEIIEVFVWSQLGLHRKPCGFLNTRGYYDPLLSFMKQMVEDRFLRAEQFEQWTVAPEAGPLLDALSRAVTVPVGKWLDRG